MIKKNNVHITKQGYYLIIDHTSPLQVNER